MIKLVTAALLVCFAAIPASAQSGFSRLDRTMDQLQNSLLQQQALNASNLTHAVNMQDGDPIFIDSSTLDRYGYVVYFDQVRIVNDYSFIRSQHSGNCASGSMTDEGGQGWIGGRAIPRNGLGTAYYAPGSYGRQILDTACDMSGGDD